MEVIQLKLGELRTNCYLVVKDKDALIIDPASDADIIINRCSFYHVKGILVTHHHWDHIGALKQLETYYNLKHNDYNNNGFIFEVIATFGHTSDSLTFYFPQEKIMFTGDFLFYHACGRCDFATSSVEEMKASLTKIKAYSDDILLYPGHGKTSILGEEKKYFDTYFK